MKLCWFLVLIHCPLCSLFPPAAHIIPSEGDKRYFACSCHYKKSFLPSVPRFCSVITDILKKQRKKLAGEGKDFCWGISAGYSSFWSWMAGRIWQQEEKWFLRIDRKSNKCVGGCVWPGFGICPSSKERLFTALFWQWSVGQSSACSHCCWMLAGPKGDISGWDGAGIWSGLHRQASLVQRDSSLPLLPLGSSLGKGGSCAGC